MSPTQTHRWRPCFSYNYLQAKIGGGLHFTVNGDGGDGCPGVHGFGKNHQYTSR